MESSDQDRLMRLLAAVREVDASPEGIAGDRRGPDARLARVGPALWLTVRALGALAVLAAGAVHLHEYLNLYSAIPTIGTLFVLNFAAATVIGLGLLAPLERVAGRRWGGIAVTLLALAAVGLAATSFVFLLVAEHTALFGFMEPGYDPAGILTSRIAEAATIAFLAPFLVARHLARGSVPRW